MPLMLSLALLLAAAAEPSRSGRRLLPLPGHPRGHDRLRRRGRPVAGRPIGAASRRG